MQPAIAAHAKALNTTLLSLLGAAVLTALTAAQRVEHKRDLRTTEQAVVALLLAADQSAASSAWSRERTTDVSRINPENFYDDWTGTYEPRRTAGASEVDALGHFMANAPAQVFRRIRLPTGGWAEYGTTAQDSRALQSGCATLEVQKAKPVAAEGEFAFPLEPPASEAAVRGAEQLFEIGIDVPKQPELLFAPYRLRFTNRFELFRPAQLEACTAIGRVTIALSRPSAAWRTQEEIAADVVGLVRSWGIALASPADAYSAFRIRYEQQTVKIPILGIETRAGYAFTFLAILGLALAGVASRQSYHLALSAKAQATSGSVDRSDQPVVVIPRFVGSGDNGLPRRVLATLEGVLIWLFHIASALGAVAIVCLGWVADGGDAIVLAPLFVAALLFSWSILSNLLTIWRARASS